MTIEKLRAKVTDLSIILGVVPRSIHWNELETANERRLIQIAQRFLADDFSCNYTGCDFYHIFKELDDMLEFELGIFLDKKTA